MIKTPQLHRRHPLEGHLWLIQMAGAALQTWLNRSSWNKKGKKKKMSPEERPQVRPRRNKATWHLDSTVLFQNLA